MLVTPNSGSKSKTFCLYLSNLETSQLIRSNWKSFGNLERISKSLKVLMLFPPKDKDWISVHFIMLERVEAGRLLSINSS